MKKLAEDYTALLLREGKATPAMFRDLTNLSRKFIIPLMEYFDKTKLTMRVGITGSSGPGRRTAMDRGNVSVVERKIRFYNGSRLMERSVSVIQESFLNVFLNERAIARIACLGVHPEELAVGFLRSEGLLRSREDLRAIRAARGEVRIEAAETEREKEQEPATLLSSGSRERGTAVPKPIPPASLPFSPADILRLMEEHLESTALHAQTRGTHGSSLADERGLFFPARTWAGTTPST